MAVFRVEKTRNFALLEQTGQKAAAKAAIIRLWMRSIRKYASFRIIQISNLYLIQNFGESVARAVSEPVIFHRKMQVSERFARAAEQKLQFLEVATCRFSSKDLS